jgi:hypothetical protein
MAVERGDVIRLSIGRETTLVSENPHRRRRLEHWMPAVLLQAVNVHDARLPGRIAHVGDEQPALRVETH